MFPAVKIIVALVLACGSFIAVIVESTHPGFVACFCGAFAVGAIAGEVVRVRRRRSVRSLARWVGATGPLRIGPAPFPWTVFRLRRL
jgi:hypothetical protein